MAVGNQGAGSTGRQLSFWQSRYFAQITALTPVAPEQMMSTSRAAFAAEALRTGDFDDLAAFRQEETRLAAEAFLQQALSQTR
jgi:hypothetical protein